MGKFTGSRTVENGKVVMGSEPEEQMMIFRWEAHEEVNIPELRLLFHIPNEGKRGTSGVRNAKLQGIKSGVPDMCLPVARGGYHGLYIELKVGKNKMDTKQKRWISDLEKQGYKAVCLHGSSAVIECIKEYLNM